LLRLPKLGSTELLRVVTQLYIYQISRQLKAVSNQEKISGFLKNRFIFPDFTNISKDFR